MHNHNSNDNIHTHLIVLNEWVVEHRTLNQSGNLLAGSFAPSNPAHFYVPAPGIKTTCARVARWNTTHFHQRVFTLWVLTVSASVYNYMFWPGMDPRWSHTCSLFPGAVTAQRSLHFPFPKEVSHEMVASCRGAFSPACRVRFWSYARLSKQAQEIRHVSKVKNHFWMAGARHQTFFIWVPGATLPALC